MRVTCLGIKFSSYIFYCKTNIRGVIEIVAINSVFDSGSWMNCGREVQ